MHKRAPAPRRCWGDVGGMNYSGTCFVPENKWETVRGRVYEVAFPEGPRQHPRCQPPCWAWRCPGLMEPAELTARRSGRRFAGAKGVALPPAPRAVGLCLGPAGGAGCGSDAGAVSAEAVACPGGQSHPAALCPAGEWPSGELAPGVQAHRTWEPGCSQPWAQHPFPGPPAPLPLEPRDCSRHLSGTEGTVARRPGHLRLEEACPSVPRGPCPHRQQCWSYTLSPARTVSPRAVPGPEHAAGMSCPLGLCGEGSGGGASAWAWFCPPPALQFLRHRSPGGYQGEGFRPGPCRCQLQKNGSPTPSSCLALKTSSVVWEMGTGMRRWFGGSWPACGLLLRGACSGGPGRLRASGPCGPRDAAPTCWQVGGAPACASEGWVLAALSCFSADGL